MAASTWITAAIDGRAPDAAYARHAMAMRAKPSALAAAVLALVGDGGTPAEIVARLAADDAIVGEAAARARLDELADLGLVRVVVGGPAPTYRVTPLGERILRTSFAADTRHADLLADIERMRSEILSVIAHEMRTPLTAVRTSVGLLLDPGIEPNAEQRRALLETIERNASRMQRVVGDILDMARFRAGRVHLQLRRFDATELASTAIASIAPLAETRRQTIELVAPPEAVTTFGDFQRLEQALVNLLSNAGKYSPADSSIRVTVASSDDEVSWSVSDHGPGIKPDDQARLFERFFVASTERAETAAGIGLGLPISLLIAQSHGGRIDVESTPGLGSTFRLVVPAAGPEGLANE